MQLCSDPLLWKERTVPCARASSSLYESWPRPPKTQVTDGGVGVVTGQFLL